MCVPLEIFTDDDTENFQIFADRKHWGDFKAGRTSRCEKNDQNNNVKGRGDAAAVDDLVI